MFPMTPTPTQTTSDTWLGFFTRDGDAAIVNDVEGSSYPIRIITCMDKKWYVDPEAESWEEDYKYGFMIIAR